MAKGRKVKVVNGLGKFTGANTIVLITHDVDEAVLLSDRVLMMTNGPAATVGEVLRVDLPRPRNRVQLADDGRYHQMRQQILHFLYEKQPKAA
jgi:nitrate/nitrite transport system ATP-binding protein